MKPYLRQFNIRLPSDLRDDILDTCSQKGWKVELACTDFLKLGLLVAKYPEIHKQMNKVIENAGLVNVPNPDYVRLAVKQYEGIEKLVDIRNNLKPIPIPTNEINAVQILTHKEVEV